jgi:hypothetical protein
MKISVLGIDLGKQVFHLYGVDAHGRQAVQKKLSRKKLLEFVHSLSRA